MRKSSGKKQTNKQTRKKEPASNRRKHQVNHKRAFLDILAYLAI